MRRHRILLVEDDVICARETYDSLKQYGYNVVEVHCARDARRVIHNHGRLSALVTDIDLGPGADGFDVARCARGLYPAMPVVFVSGTAAARHLAEGVTGSRFVAKPFHPSQILSALDHVIGLEAA